MRVRIVCTRPPQSSAYPMVQLLASGKDCKVFVVEDDGEERLLEGVTRIEWSCGGPSDVATARIEVAGVELNVEGVVEGKGPA